MPKDGTIFHCCKQPAAYNHKKIREIKGDFGISLREYKCMAGSPTLKSALKQLKANRLKNRTRNL